MKEITLDVRGLPAPEPLIQALDAVAELGDAEILRLVIHREPHMLFPELTEGRIPWQIVNHGDPDWIIRIGPRPARAA